MDAQFVEQMKERLTAERERIVKELESFAHRNTDAKDDDFVTDYQNFGEEVDDNAAEVAQYTNNLSVESELEKMLRDVEKALKRFEDGTYGVCKYCNEEINPKRLEARPDSSSCITCKKTFTKEA